jgi:hypothetical protein
MKPIRTKNTNRTYTGKCCEALPATAVKFADGKVAVEACFELTDDEVKDLVENKKIYITFTGETIIPFMLNTKSINSGGDNSHGSGEKVQEKP